MQFFGLSLVRDFLSNTRDASLVTLSEIRSNVMLWLSANLARLKDLEPFIVNNMACIITLAIKREYPEVWSTAFKDIFYFGKQNLPGLKLVVAILHELDVEVVNNT